MLGKLLRLGQIIKNPSTIPALFSWRPFSIESFTMMSSLAVGDMYSAQLSMVVRT